MNKRVLVPVVLLLFAVDSGCANVRQTSQPDSSNRILKFSRDYYVSGMGHLKNKKFFSAAKDFLISAELDEKFYDAWDHYYALQPVLQGHSRDWGEEVEFPFKFPGDGWSLVIYEVGKKLMELGEYRRARAIFVNDLELCDCLPPPFQEWKPYLKSAIEECSQHIDSHPESK